MLYITTRDKTDSFTAPRSITADRGPDGGLFVPFRMPKLELAEIEALSEKTFGQAVADVLNLFFSAGLTGWDVDFAVGRSPVKQAAMNYRIWMVETWHNQQWDFDWLVRHLMTCVSGKELKITDWAKISARIAVLFGVFGELLRDGIVDSEHPIDVAVMAGDFSGPMAVWYAREMGLPVGTIVCSCNENSAPWDLLHHGQIYTDTVAVSTGLPEADYSLPPDLERLVFSALGYDENRRYCDACRQGKLYTPDPELAEKLRSGMFGAVVSRKRMDGIIRNVYRTNSYLLDPYAALAYGGLQDYRAKTGESRPALILSERSPSRSDGIVAAALGVSVQELNDRLRNS